MLQEPQPPSPSRAPAPPASALSAKPTSRCVSITRGRENERLAHYQANESNVLTSFQRLRTGKKVLITQGKEKKEKKKSGSKHKKKAPFGVPAHGVLRSLVC